MNTAILIRWAPTGLGGIIPSAIAFFPASAVGNIYNYAIASAGTITSKDNADITGNMNTATESICPKGWTLPTTKQIDANRDTASFSPVLGGNYYNGRLYDESKYGLWWSSTAHNGANRSTCIPMVVAYIPATTTAAAAASMGTMCGALVKKRL